MPSRDAGNGRICGVHKWPDLTRPPRLDRDAVLHVFDCRFVADAANVVFVGGVGTGKTHLSIALGMACCQHDYRVRFVTAAEYERRSLVVTTNLPFARWAEVFLDATAAAAVIDRIVHHATVLTTAGDSYRLKTATRNQASRAPQEVPRQ